jgi:SulP family sulfate permease
MSAAMAVLAGTGLAGWLAERFPIVLVRGIQASVALLLASAAIELAERGNWEGLPAIDPAVGVAVAVVACGVLLACRRSWRVPGSLAVLAAGAGVGLAVAGVPSGVGLGPEQVAVSIPDGGAFVTALTALVIAQIPLTFGNSVVATVDAERSYFGDRARRVTAGRLAGSIAIWNTAAGLTAGLPVCHGAGGVTAHYRLGARTAYATGAAGALFLVLGVALGDSLPILLQLLAPGALAGMLLFVAIQHAMLAARLERLDDRAIVAGVGLVTLFSGNLAIGFAAGIATLAIRRAWRSGVETRRPASIG